MENRDARSARASIKKSDRKKQQKKATAGIKIWPPI
jgi:hypothetical protein